jgi:hypothetical protein
MLVAPVVTHVNSLPDPAVTLVGLALNDVIVGFVEAAVTVTVAVDVTEPVLFVAVNV